MDSRQSSGNKSSIFALRGDLDGGKDLADFTRMQQYIGLLIGSEEFLLPIEVMNEIIMINSITYVPGAPRFIEGVINLRGRIVPAINLGQMLGHKTTAPSSESRIIIAQHLGQSAGLIVDGITFVVSLQPHQTQPQTIGKGKSTQFIVAISKTGAKMNGILDIEKLFLEVAGTKGTDAPQINTSAS